MIYKAYFSPTGGTRKCLDILCPEGKEIDLTRRDYYEDYHLTSSDILYVALPSFGGRCPALAIERLKKIKGANTKAVIMAIYGNRAFEDTLIELYDNLNSQGFIITAALSCIAEHSMIREIAKGRPDEEDKKKLSSFKPIIMKSLEKREKIKNIPGSRPYKSISKFLTPKADEKCIRCGKCYISCPSGAIDEMMPNLTDEEKCIGCARCIAICPQKARKYEDEAFSAVKERIKKLAAERKEAELFL